VDVPQLTLMANQIARNFAVQGEEVAIEATKQHIIEYWAPQMRAAILLGNFELLSPIARDAIIRLQADGAVSASAPASADVA
jgi:formate dehydrogenase subunit delta